jgi:hypothetical protein
MTNQISRAEFLPQRHWHSSPMIYAIDGQEYVAVAMNSSIVAFGLPQ